jgi:hypothetical protein
MFSRVFFVFSATAAILLSAGCASQVEEIPEDYGHIKFKRPEKVVYEQISTKGMELAVPAEVHALAGTRQTIDVQLINRSKRKVVIKEWYMLDNYNFSIFYRKMPADKPLDPSVPFKEYTVRIPLKPLPKHAELQLLPNNRAVLTVDLPFVGELNPGENAAFEVYVATSLKTFKIKSKSFMLYAR